MVKRGRLEIVKDILDTVKGSHGMITITPLIRRANVSSSRFKEYYGELLKKEFIKEVVRGEKRVILLTEKGERFLEKYNSIRVFINEFEL